MSHLLLAGCLTCGQLSVSLLLDKCLTSLYTRVSPVATPVAILVSRFAVSHQRFTSCWRCPPTGIAMQLHTSTEFLLCHLFHVLLSSVDSPAFLRHFVQACFVADFHSLVLRSQQSFFLLDAIRPLCLREIERKENRTDSSSVSLSKENGHLTADAEA